jgi:thiaminase/transcriptional activator TenA
VQAIVPRDVAVRLLERAARGRRRRLEAQHAHPFVRGISDGTLSVERFEHYVRQDYLFLVEYARMLALGAARAPDLATMRRFADLAQAILGEEMQLHRALARELGIDEADLQAEQAAPTTQAYTDFLVRTAALADVDRLGAAADEEGRARMTRGFLTCSRYELAFWEMGWTLERWPSA